MNVQKIAAVVLLIVLLITMFVVYMMLYYSSNNLSFPPKISKCPDGGCVGVPSVVPKPCDGTVYDGNWDGITNVNCDV